MRRQGKREDKWIKLEDLRESAERPVLEAMKSFRSERPGLVEEAALAARVLAKRRCDGGRMS